MKDVISLGIGEPDFVTPAHISQAGIDSVSRGDTHYTSNSGTAELRRGARRRGLFGAARARVYTEIGAKKLLQICDLCLMES